MAKSYSQRKFVKTYFKKLIYRDTDHLHFRCLDPFILRSQASDLEQQKLKCTKVVMNFRKVAIAKLTEHKTKNYHKIFLAKPNDAINWQ